MSKKHIRIATLVVVGLSLLASAYAYALYQPADQAVRSIASNGELTDFLTPEPLSGESSGAVNILIVGNSADDAGHGGAELTDSIMVAHYDLSTRRLSLISVPRDVWVTVDGSSMKLNAVYTVGGLELLESTIQDITGLAIDHHVLLNYQAVKTAVDAVGGIDITIESSDERGIYDPMIGFSIANGEQHLDGEQALKLARSRNDPTYDGRIAYGLPNGDFDRMANQRKIVLALLQKVTETSALTNVGTFTDLVDSLSGSITTNLSVGQLRRVFDLSRQVGDTQAISIRGNDEAALLTDYVSYDGQAALVPVSGAGMYEDIQTYIAAQLSG